MTAKAIYIKKLVPQGDTDIFEYYLSVMERLWKRIIEIIMNTEKQKISIVTR